MKSKIQEISFRKGEKYRLNDLFEVANLGGFDWWEPYGKCGEGLDVVIIKKDINFKIQITK